MELSLDEIAEILSVIEGMDCTRVEVSVGDIRIVVDRGAVDLGAQAALPPAGRPEATAPDRAPRPVSGAGSATPGPPPATVAPPAPPQSSTPSWHEREAAGEIRVVRAPMVGSFYLAKEPGADPFVSVGARVSEGDTVGIVEVMKLFHSVLSDVAGTVETILANDGQAVEYGQPLVVIAR